MRGLIVDDHQLFREALPFLLEQTAPDITFDLAADIARAEVLLSQFQHKLILLDWNLEGTGGVDGLKRIRDAAPQARIVIVSGETDSKIVRQAVDAGASGFIPKTASPAVLSMAVRLICAGGIYLPGGAWPIQPPEVLDSAAAKLPTLTLRQIDVFKLMVRGMPNKEIARALSIVEATVKVHMTAIFRALNVRNRTEAVYAAARKGLKID